MRLWGENHHARLLCGAAVFSLMAASAPAYAQQAAVNFNIPPQPLQAALDDFAAQSRHAILSTPNMTASKVTPGVSGVVDSGAALTQLLAGTGLSHRLVGETFLIVQAGEGGSSPQGESAEDGNAVEALIVTAQKREEAIQDVPIAISAFSAKSLEEQKIEGGFDLLKAIPNVTFSKSNFSSYNFSIRGIGTKAISATTDPGVAVAFNSTPLIQNRLFEQEYFDVERVEVLRGPQGTLYGRNATAGVINVISAKPKLGEFEGSAKVEVGNFDSRRAVGMVNIPIIEDMLAVRLAGAMTQRSGYDYNSVTENAVNGRDLWSARVTIGFEPIDSIRANLIWERFEEDDDRSRTGKQLCHRDPGLTTVGSTDLLPHTTTGGLPNDRWDIKLMRPALFSQACKPGSLYDDAAFGTPNGLALPFVYGALFLNAGEGAFFPIGNDPVTGISQGVVRLEDPYGGMMQSRDLRTIASFRDPRYRATADLLELNIDVDLTDALTFTSQTAYNEDTVYSFQDYNRFNTLPVFNDTSLLVGSSAANYRNLAPGGVFCDPQLGCSNTLAGFDISQAEGRQFSQEFRLQSDFDGPVNFSVGANYTRFETLIDYYVFYNILTLLAITAPFNGGPNNPTSDISLCTLPAIGTLPGGVVSINDPQAGCPYIDPNPIESINGEGHNYFRSKNPYKLRSAAAFGELYWNITEDLKLTAGLRYTDDLKTFVPVPSQVLLGRGLITGGAVNRGYPAKPAIEQQWGEFTGRLGLDWKPVLPFTDQTMVYGFYSRGYKGGGANPPTPGYATGQELFQLAQEFGVTVSGAVTPPLELTAVEYGRTFEPEFVNAFEIGAKNTLLDGAMTFNVGAFYYDYKDYQVSQIRDRTAVNENFNAKVWGLEFETVFNPTRDLRINANLGYLDTEISDGETSIDIMNRTQGDPGYVVVKPWLQLPSNCVLPNHIVETWATSNFGQRNFWSLCGGGGGFFTHVPIIDTNPLFGGGVLGYDHRNYPQLNGGAGIRAQLGGKELPNSPHWTSNIGAQYRMDMPAGWRATVRGDFYWQSQSFARVYNAVNDKLRAWTNANLSVWVEQPDWGLKVELYAKNIFDDTPITDAFLNSDDTGLTTNVFTLDPRVVGLSVRKDF